MGLWTVPMPQIVRVSFAPRKLLQARGVHYLVDDKSPFGETWTPGGQVRIQSEGHRKHASAPRPYSWLEAPKSFTIFHHGFNRGVTMSCVSACEPLIQAPESCKCQSRAGCWLRPLDDWPSDLWRNA